MQIFEIKHLVHSCSRMHPFIFNCALVYMYKRKQLKHCYDDRANILLHRIPVLTLNTINFVVKNKRNGNLNNESTTVNKKVTLPVAHEFEKSCETRVSSWSKNIRKR